jgi:CRP-like cAMP-binding protein
MANDKPPLLDELKQLFGAIGWLSQQPEAFRNTLLPEGRILRIERDQAVYREGDPGGSIYGVIAGGIGAIIGPPLLSPRLGHIVRPGSWFGVGPVLSGGSRSMEFRATEPSVLLMVPFASIQRLGERDQETVRRLGALANNGFDMAVRVAAELLIPASARRVAAVLLRVAATNGLDGQATIQDVTLSQVQLAEMSNVSRNLVNAALRRFKARGWLQTNYGRVRIMDRAALAGFAYADD